MKLHLTTAERQNLVTGYEEGCVAINQQRHTMNLIVMPENVVLNWHQGGVKSLTPEAFIALAALTPEVVLLGTGRNHQFLHPSIYQHLTTQGIPLECMTTAAACRTYNILMSEGRNVAAALLLE
jgi:uncharacterized protein